MTDVITRTVSAEAVRACKEEGSGVAGAAGSVPGDVGAADGEGCATGGAWAAARCGVSNQQATAAAMPRSTGA